MEKLDLLKTYICGRESNTVEIMTTYKPLFKLELTFLWLLKHPINIE